MTTEHYFAVDGNYGDATEGILIIDTTNWTDEHWRVIDEAPDYYRMMVAHRLHHGYTIEEAEDY